MLQVHDVDFALVTEVTSFVHLIDTCQTGQSSLPMPQDVPQMGVASEGRGGSVVEFQLTSLLAKSNVCAITMAAFSEGTS